MGNAEDTQRASLIGDLLNAFRTFSDEAAKLRLQCLRARTPISANAYEDVVSQSASENRAIEDYLRVKEEVLAHLETQSATTRPGPRFAMRGAEIVEPLKKTS